MNWIHNGKEITRIEDFDGAIGFVYLIENLETSRKYVGKKILHFTKARQVNKKRKRYKEESDWKTYYGSSDDLLRDLEILGPEKFSRVILHLCHSKAEMSYLELAEQISREALLREDYYNSWISARVRTSHLKGLQKQ